jgi:hypothetical protein
MLLDPDHRQLAPLGAQRVAPVRLLLFLAEKPHPDF